MPSTSVIVPSPAVSVSPTRAVPEIEGLPVAMVPEGYASLVRDSPVAKLSVNDILTLTFCPSSASTSV